MGEVIRMAAMAAVPINRKASNNMSDNRRSGYVVCWRSLLQADWARNTTKLAAWMRLIGLASYKAGCVRYKGRDWHLMRGQLVISATELGLQLCDERGRSLDKKATERLLGWFAKEGMIELRGTPWGSIIEICNYDDYQEARQPVESNCEQFATEQFECATNGAPIGAPIGVLTVPPKTFADAALSGDAVAPTVAPIGAPTVTTTEQQTNTLKEKNKPSSSQLADATFDQQSEQPITAEPVSAEPSSAEPNLEPKTRVIPEAAIQTPSGKAWGTAEDLQTAQWMFARVQRINSTALEPNWPQWANVIRLMRKFDQRSHSDICELYDWVSRDPFWCVNVLSPQKLRQKWDQLTAKRHAAPLLNKRPLGNLAAAQQQAQAIMANSGVGYDDDTIL